MKMGYARVSTSDQHADRQHAALKDYGVDQGNIYTDYQSGKDFKRDNYQALIKAIRPGDVVVIQSLDRFGRDYDEIRKEFKRITDKGVAINVVDTPILNTDQVLEGNLTMKFISDLVLSVLGYVAEKERADIKQRQKEGIRTAKQRGVVFGRPSAESQARKVARLLAADPDKTVEEACKMYNISRRTYYNYKQKDFR